ncbi:MAG: ABC transporter permease [Anaerolineae bacterium]|jgi:ABC-type lipoprotein release transport system permease subunit
MFRLWKIAIRDLGRNKRRSGLTLVAVALGLALLVVTSSLMEGAVADSIENNIRVKTGHVQIRNASYDEDKASLKWEDLLENPQEQVARALALPQVRVATPVVWASGILATGEESVGVRVFGIDPLSETAVPFQEGLVAGQFLTPDDRSGILIGQRLAESLGIGAGHDVSLLINTSDEQPDEAIFTVRGLYDTGTPAYDETTIFLPLTKAQAFARTPDRASAVVMLLHDQDDAEAVAAALQAPGLELLTWLDLNQVVIQAVDMSQGIMYLMYLVVLAVVAVVIANTLLMSVFERTREMGILAALGMKGRQILAMFVMEAGTLAVLGIILGILLGCLGVYYLATEGLYIGEAAAGAASADVAYGDTLYARFSLSETVTLSVAGLLITLLASLYPAWFAARMEPIDALRAL